MISTDEGYGPDPANCFEEYVCAQGRSGDYAIRVRLASGEVVGHRATLTIIRHQGTPAESVETRSIAIGQDESIVRIPLENGRRTSARPVMPRETAAGPMSAVKPPAIVVPAPGARRVPLPAKVTQAALEYEQSRAQMEGMQIRRTGAVGFQPMIQIVPDGATFAAQAVVSPDRRYVRIGVSPVFTNLTDVFTHTFVRGR